MNRQILAARLGPYTDPALAEYAESEDFIIGIILDRFGISPVLDEFHSQPVYLPGQRGYNPDNCAVEFPHYIGYWEDEDSTPSTPARVFNAPPAMPQNMSSSTTYPVDMQIEENHPGQYQVSEIEHDPRFVALRISSKKLLTINTNHQIGLQEQGIDHWQPATTAHIHIWPGRYRQGFTPVMA